MSAVQFIGIAAVMQAYNNRECPDWAIYSGKQFLFKYEKGDQQEGEQLLEQTLKALEHSTATYTIKFYEREGKKPLKIKDNTPYDGSFNFKICSPDVMNERTAYFSSSNRELLEKINGLEQRLAEMDEDDEEEESQPQGIEGALMAGINNIVSNPQMMANVLSALFGVKGNGQPAAIAGVPQDQQLQQAIEILKKNDPKITEHLAKLANISENDKSTYNYLAGLLDKM